MPAPAPVLSGRAGPADGLDTYRLDDGTVIAVQDDGPGDAAATVVLVHGWSQDHTSWDDVVPVLRAEHPELRVIAYDARGHGHSDAGPRGKATVDQFADDLADVVEGLVVGGANPDSTVVIAGHSLGGPIIIAFAQRHPALVAERLRGAVLVATSGAGLGKDLFGLSGVLTAPALRIAPIVTRARSWSRAKINLHHPGLLAWAIRRGFYGAGADTPRNRYRTAAQTSRAHPATSAQLVDEMIRFDRLDALAPLDAPTTVVLAGTHDGLCPLAHSRALAAAMPNAELIVYPKAGHMLPYEKPSEVAEVVGRLAEKAA